MARGVPYDGFGEPSRFPDGVAVQPCATGSAAKLQKSAAPYAVLKKRIFRVFSKLKASAIAFQPRFFRLI